MVMQEQARRLREPLRWGRRERAAVAVLISCTALALIGLVVYGLTKSAGPSRRDCVNVTFASTLGGAALKGCGERARNICAHGAQFPALRGDLEAACARAGFVYKG
jgi:hypothetical protein